MEPIRLEENNFEGSLDLTRLPNSIRKICLSENHFSGIVDLGNLPESMKYLDVSKNALSGTVRVQHTRRVALDKNDELTVEHIQ